MSTWLTVSAALLLGFWTGGVPALDAARHSHRGGHGQPDDGTRFAAGVRAILGAGRHQSLRWPDLGDVNARAVAAYRRTGWRPLWLTGGRPGAAARAILAVIGDVAERGLAAPDFDHDSLAAMARRLENAGPGVEDQVSFDLALTTATLRLAETLHEGRLDPRSVAPGWRIGPPRLDVGAMLDTLRSSGDPAAVLDRLEPQDSVYRGLKRWLARYRAMARGGADAPLPVPAPAVKTGGRYPAVAALRRRLATLGDLGASPLVTAAPDSSYDPSTAEAVRRFQRRHGLSDDGVLGRVTMARLNEPLSRRVRQIELALERRRWWPAPGAMPAIVVNVPAFRLTAADSDSSIVMKVIAGQAKENETPVFTAGMSQVIFLPYWEVPTSIVKKEIRPKAIRNPGYLEQEGMDLLEGDRVIPATSQNVSRLGEGVRVRQRPGPRNALGRVKFLLASGYAVHLHDTPIPKLFASARRDFSHGCIRVADPVALARFVLRSIPGWSSERIAAAMAADTSVTVVLPTPLAVAVTYETVSVMGDQIEFRPDLYGRDQRLARLLAAGYPYRKRIP